MIRRIFVCLAGIAAVSLVPQPLAAQTEADPHSETGAAEMDQTMAMLGKMFPAEPLTAEQEARLRQAKRIITRMIPDGTLGEMMGGMLDKMLGPIMAASDAPANAVVFKGIGMSPATLGLSEEQTAEIAVLLDPAYADRHQREMSVMPVIMRDMMTAMEPTMRSASCAAPISIE